MCSLQGMTTRCFSQYLKNKFPPLFLINIIIIIIKMIINDTIIAFKLTDKYIQ